MFRKIALSMSMLASLCVSTAAVSAQEDVCEKVVVTGMNNWAPFSTRSEEGLRGLGVDLVSKVFEELDIPVEIRIVDKPVILEKYLRNGIIDVLVATYDVPVKHRYLDYIQPAYYDDSLVLVTRKDNPLDSKEWNQLIGRTGLSLLNNDLGFEFGDFAEQFLFIEKKPNMHGVLKLIDAEHADYFVGSRALVKYVLENRDDADKMMVQEPELATQPVHIAMSKNSACHIYLPYIQSAVANLVEGQAIEPMFNHSVRLLRYN